MKLKRRNKRNENLEKQLECRSFASFFLCGWCCPVVLTLSFPFYFVFLMMGNGFPAICW